MRTKAQIIADRKRKSGLLVWAKHGPELQSSSVPNSDREAIVELICCQHASSAIAGLLSLYREGDPFVLWCLSLLEQRDQFNRRKLNDELANEVTYQ